MIRSPRVDIIGTFRQWALLMDISFRQINAHMDIDLLRKERVMKRFALASIVLILAACGGTEMDVGVAGQTAVNEITTPTVTGTTAYYSVTRDLRRCMSPMCGGYWIKRVNKATTKCVDGTFAAQCYVFDIDDAALGLNDDELAAFQSDLGEGLAIVRAKIKAQAFGTLGTFGLLSLIEGWVASAPATVTGTHYLVTGTPVRCFAAPCFSISARTVNSTYKRMISDLNLGVIPDEEKEAEGYATVAEGKTLIVSGAIQRIPRAGPAGTGKKLNASQVWFRVLHKETNCSDPLAPCPD